VSEKLQEFSHNHELLIAKGEHMASKEKGVREGQKTYWERKLSQRIEILTGNELAADMIEKDTVIKKIRAKIRETINRLKTIENKEKKIEEMARIKEERKAAPPKEKPKKEKASEKAPAEKAKKKKKKEEKPGEQAKEAAPKEDKAAPVTEAEKEEKETKKASAKEEKDVKEAKKETAEKPKKKPAKSAEDKKEKTEEKPAEPEQE